MKLLGAFEVRDFRWLWGSHALNSTSMMMNRLAVGWLVLELTDSPAWVGAVAGLDGLGKLAFGVLAGVLVDRFDKRKLLSVSLLANGLAALTLGALILMDRIALWHILAYALWQGTNDPVLSSSINAVNYQIVGRSRVTNAVAVKMMGFNLARILGSAAAGALIARWGVGACYLAVGAVASASALSTCFIQGTFRSAVITTSFWRAAAEGIRYVWTNGPVRQLLQLSVIVEMLAFSHYTMVPVIARDVLRVGAAGLGFLSSASGIGAMAGTLLLASLGDYPNKSGLLSRVILAGGGLLIAFAVSPWYPISLVLATIIGALLVIYDVLMQTLIQLLAPDAVRGRVYSLYVLTFGFNSLGGFLAGTIATALGAPLAVGLGGAIVFVYALSALGPLRHIRPTANEVAVPAGD